MQGSKAMTRGARESDGRLLVFGAAYGAVLLWGATPMVTKVAVAEIDPLAVGALRTLLAALAAAPLILLGRLRPPRSAGGRGYLAVSSLGGFVVFPLLFSVGLGRTSAGHGALLLGILPVLTGLIAAFLEWRRPGGRWWFGCAVALAGTALLVGARFGLSAEGSSWQGDMMVLAAAFFAAAGYVAGAHAAREAGTWPVTLWGLSLAGLVLLPLSPVLVSVDALGAASAPALGAVAYLALVTSVLGYAAWYWALGRGGIGRTGLAQFVQPVVGLVLAVAVLGEAVTWPMLLAAATILGGVALARR